MSNEEFKNTENVKDLLILPCDENRPYVFVSYSSVDKDIVWEDVVYLQGTRWHGVQSLSNFVKSAVSDAIIDWYDYEEEEWGDVTHESWDLTE